MNINKLMTLVKSPRLYKTSRKSSQEVLRLKQELLFQSKTMKELFTDAFEYKGNEKGVIYLMDRATGKPTPVLVKIKQNPFMGKKEHVVENLYLINPENNLIVAHKHYDINLVEGGKKIMYQGEMGTYDTNFVGAGIRLDQIQIARALEIGAESIPRSSYPQSVIYHMKMGFLPIENLELMKSTRALNKYARRNYKSHYSKLSSKYFKPIVVRKENKFYLDKDWTLVRACVLKCKEVLESTKKSRVRGFDSFIIRMQLSGEELAKWKKILEKFPILDKLKPIENQLL